MAYAKKRRNPRQAGRAEAPPTRAPAAACTHGWTQDALTAPNTPRTLVCGSCGARSYACTDCGSLNPPGRGTGGRHRMPNSVSQAWMAQNQCPKHPGSVHVPSAEQTLLASGQASYLQDYVRDDDDPTRFKKKSASTAGLD